GAVRAGGRVGRGGVGRTGGFVDDGGGVGRSRGGHRLGGRGVGRRRGGGVIAAASAQAQHGGSGQRRKNKLLHPVILLGSGRSADAHGWRPPIAWQPCA